MREEGGVQCACWQDAFSTDLALSYPHQKKKSEDKERFGGSAEEGRMRCWDAGLKSGIVRSVIWVPLREWNKMLGRKKDVGIHEFISSIKNG
jgi:hypothetical protein